MHLIRLAYTVHLRLWNGLDINMTPIHIYTNESGQEIPVIIVADHGMINKKGSGQWHKVECRPLGFNNTLPLFLDMATLRKDLT